MAELKTKKTRASVSEFLNGIEDPDQRADALRLKALMQKITGNRPAMWGESIVGFGSHRYKYATGHVSASVKQMTAGAIQRR